MSDTAEMSLAMSDKELDGKTALVTGATRGIGAAICDALIARGAFVVGTATTQAGAQTISTRLGAHGVGKVLQVQDSASCEAVIASCDSDHGGVAILVNNAGITRDGLLMRMKDDDFFEVMNTNLGSVFRLSKMAMKGMLKRRAGRIISIASVVGVMGNPGQSNYAAAKAGIIGFSKSLAKEIGSRGITVNVVAPGFIETDMTANLSAEARDTLVKQIALTRLGQPHDIANAVAFLASDAASYITGETLHVNGGMHMV
jgi:3-oxoacyl-[acyl-carrier protein] reductase